MRNIICAVCLIIPLNFSFAGITRDDVDEKEYLKLAQQPQFDCVGQVFEGTQPAGSCVLISNKFILSAAHVFVVMDRKTTGTKKTKEVSGFSFEFKGKIYLAKSVKIFSSYLDAALGEAGDIALIELVDSVKNISPAAYSRNFDELHSSVVGVGFGASGKAGEPSSVGLKNKKIAGENEIDSLNGFQHNGKETVLLFDFDHPTKNGLNRMGSPIPKPMEYIGSGGDSGGGLFRRKDDKWELIGIFHATIFDLNNPEGFSYYGQVAEWTRVSAFADWIDKNIQ